jgi:competence protein ComEC
MVPSRRTLGTLVAALAFLFLVPAAFGDQVTPNERVKTRLRAKDQLGPEGNVVGYLKPGDKAVLVRTTGAWREVKAATWTGYVPSGYTTVIPDEPAPSSTTPAVQPKPATNAKPTSEKTGTCGDGKVLKVHFYNVSQALAVLVDLPDGRHVLVDAGDAPNRAGCGAPCKTAHEHLLTQLGSDLGGKGVDIFWATHQHSDHIGGVPGVLAKFKTSVYVDNGQDEGKPTVKAARAAAGDATMVVVDPIHPLSSTYSSQATKLTSLVPSQWPVTCSSAPNSCSIGLRIDYCKSSVLFVGDAEDVEEAVLDTNGAVTLLQVGHHGSSTSSTDAFITKVSPKYAVISAGAPGEGMNKTYCHPWHGTVDRITQALGDTSGAKLRVFSGAKCARSKSTDWTQASTSKHLWATERDGDVVLTTTGDGEFTAVAGGSN